MTQKIELSAEERNRFCDWCIQSARHEMDWARKQRAAQNPLAQVSVRHAQIFSRVAHFLMPSRDHEIFGQFPEDFEEVEDFDVHPDAD